ncbi:MAG: hypothetical protein H6813_06355 [Phycisphaeraceae bacterium]|nr:hypothetical protein [Phycisphaeraceae bacterium]MCB9848093.1 hypothetical protein [Phycisphaeraceae bacterium]
MLGIRRILVGGAVALGLAGAAGALNPVVDDLKIEASDPVTGDEFGWDVSILGSLAVIGAPLDNINGANSGSAYLFAKGASGLWFETQKITPGNAASTANFGASVAMGDGFCVVGAPVQPTGGMFRAGSAYVFTFDGVDWAETAELIPPTLATKDRLGYSAAVSGDVAVIGAPGDGFFDFTLGKAFVYRRLATGHWTLEASLLASDAAANDHFGASVAIDGDRLIVGADRNDDNGDSSGSAYVFERSAQTGQWTQKAKLTALGAASGDQFGFAVAIEGDLVAVSAFRDDYSGLNNAGTVRLFRRNGGGAWPEIATLDAGSGAVAADVFGSSVAIANGVVFAGAPTEASPLVSPGRVYVFEETAGAGGWTRSTTLDPIDGQAGDFFGNAVASDGQRAICGARWDDNIKENAGSATVFAFVEDCLGDLNGDGQRDTADLGLMLSVFGSQNIDADLNGDGVVDTADVGAMIAAFGVSCP